MRSPRDWFKSFRELSPGDAAAWGYIDDVHAELRAMPWWKRFIGRLLIAKSYDAWACVACRRPFYRHVTRRPPLRRSAWSSCYPMCDLCKIVPAWRTTPTQLFVQRLFDE